jgi:competence protein ComEC
VRPEAESVAGTLEAFGWYATARAKGRHINAKPGDRLPLAGIEVVVVSAAGATLARPLSGAGERNATCGGPVPPQEPNENPRSTGVRLQFGKFGFLDLGDLTGTPLFALVCPRDLVGPVDVYLVAHHGGADAADPATFAAFRPRVAVVDNGARKGGAPALLSALRSAPGLEDAWQLHRSLLADAQNIVDDRIANLDETSSHWITLSAKEDGSFVVTNGRTGTSKRYAAR